MSSRPAGLRLKAFDVRAQAPTHRPTWVLVLGSMMLLTSGYSLISGLLKLRDPAVVLSVSMANSSGSEAELQLSQRLVAVRAATLPPHRAALRVESLAEVALALFGLYATAAVMARDRHGRSLALAVGALVIVYRIGALPVYLSLMRDYAERGADLMATAILQNAGSPTDLTAADLAHRLKTALVSEPVVVAAIGIAGALVLLVFFGGRRGRALYGIGAPPRPRPGNVS